MTDERLFELLAAHAGPADVDPAFEDRLYALLLQQRRSSARTARSALLLVAALLALLAISAAVALGSGVLRLPVESVRPTPSSPEASAAPIRDLSLPGTRGDEPAGVYGWTGALGASDGMHHVVGDIHSFHQTQVTFKVRNDCFGSAGDPVSVIVAGLDGLYLEPYKPPVIPFSKLGGETTGAYALPIGDRTLCVYLTWDPATTPGELEEARQVIESIRGEPFGVNGIRINFTLPARWDTG